MVCNFFLISPSSTALLDEVWLHSTPACVLFTFHLHLKPTAFYIYLTPTLTLTLALTLTTTLVLSQPLSPTAQPLTMYVMPYKPCH